MSHVLLFLFFPAFPFFPSHLSDLTPPLFSGPSISIIYDVVFELIDGRDFLKHIKEEFGLLNIVDFMTFKYHVDFMTFKYCVDFMKSQCQWYSNES